MSMVLVRRCPMNAARLPWPGNGHNGFADIEVRVPADDVSELRTAISRAWNVAPECILLLDTAGDGVAALTKKASAHVDPTTPIPAVGPSMVVTVRLRRSLRTTWQPRDAADGSAAACWGCGGTRSIEGDQSDACLELLCGHTHCGACAAQVVSEGHADGGVVHCMHCMGRTFHSGVEAPLRRGRSSATAAAASLPSSTPAEDTEALQHQVSQHCDRLMRAFHWLARHRRLVVKTMQQPRRNYGSDDEHRRVRAERLAKTLTRLDADLMDLAAARDEVIVQATRVFAGEPVPELSERASRTLRMHGDTRYREVMRSAFVPRRDQHFATRSATPDSDANDDRVGSGSNDHDASDYRETVQSPWANARDIRGGDLVLWTLHNGYDGPLRMLKDVGLPVNVCDGEGTESIILAAQRGWGACIEVLIAAGVNPDTCGLMSMTPGHYAARDGNVACLRALHAGGARFNCRDLLGETAVHKAAKAGSLASLKCMHELGVYLEAPHERGATVAHLAAEAGSGECLRFLHACGISLSTPKDTWADSETPAFSALGNGDSLRTLYELGVDLHALNSKSRNIAFSAAKMSPEVLREVHSYGVDLYQVDNENVTFVHYFEAAWLLPTLLDLGFALDRPVAVSGMTPSRTAAKYRDQCPSELRFLHACCADHDL